MFGHYLSSRQDRAFVMGQALSLALEHQEEPLDTVLISVHRLSP
jgi:hypothetical protein